jgi:hypothetical protein
MSEETQEVEQSQSEEALEQEAPTPEFEAPVEEGKAGEPADPFGEAFPETPELLIPPPEAEVHRGIIEGLEVFEAQTGSVGVKVNLKSIDAELEDSLTYWPPIEYVQNIFISPDEITTEVAEGKKQSPRQRYGAVVANSNKKAELQVLKALAADAGKTAADLRGHQVTDFESLVVALDILLTGLPVVFVRDVEKNNDPAFADRLKIKRIASIKTADNPKLYKKLKKMWTEQ